MTLTVRLPLRVEQALAEYCVTHGVGKSEAVKEALNLLLEADKTGSTSYELGKDLFTADDTPSTKFVSYSKKNLRALAQKRRHR